MTQWKGCIILLNMTPLCYYCASDNVTSEVPPDVYPLCGHCISKEHVKKRSK